MRLKKSGEEKERDHRTVKKDASWFQPMLKYNMLVKLGSYSQRKTGLILKKSKKLHLTTSACRSSETVESSSIRAAGLGATREGGAKEDGD